MNILINKQKNLTLLTSETEEGLSPVALVGGNIGCDFCSHFGNVVLVSKEFFACENCFDEVSKMSEDEKEEKVKQTKEYHFKNPRNVEDTTSTLENSSVDKILDWEYKEPLTLQGLSEKLSKVIEYLGLDKKID